MSERNTRVVCGIRWGRAVFTYGVEWHSRPPRRWFGLNDLGNWEATRLHSKGCIRTYGTTPRAAVLKLLAAEKRVAEELSRG